MTPAAILRRHLDDISSVVMIVDFQTYTARPLPAVSGSIGEHVRHCLDHIAALVAARSPRPLSYDHRERGTFVERDPAEAMRQVLRLKAALDRWDGRTFDDPVCVVSLIAIGQRVTGWSTLGRELAFVASHTTHHVAVIALLMAVLGVSAPEGLGYAPSTPKRAV
jgi:hypothetical protein